MKKILVPTDFSDAAFNALEYATNLAHKINAEIILLNSFALPSSSVMIDLLHVLENDSKNGLKEEKSKITSKYPEIKIETVSINNDLVSAVKKCSEKYKVDYIIMGTTGADGIKEAFVGSNTSRLIQEVNIPIIAIPLGCVLTPNLNIAVSSDLKTLKSISVFDHIKDIANHFKSEFHLINVSEDLSKVDPTDFVEHAADIDDIFLDYKHSFKFLENNDYETEILDYISTSKINLLVVVSRKRNFFKRLFHKSISKKLTMHSPVPIVVLTE
jgi:nucleotide-binding universal stress UspA family protein